MDATPAMPATPATPETSFKYSFKALPKSDGESDGEITKFVIKTSSSPYEITIELRLYELLRAASLPEEEVKEICCSKYQAMTIPKWTTTSPQFSFVTTPDLRPREIWAFPIKVNFVKKSESGVQFQMMFSTIAGLADDVENVVHLISFKSENDFVYENMPWGPHLHAKYDAM